MKLSRRRVGVACTCTTTPTNKMEKLGEQKHRLHRSHREGIKRLICTQEKVVSSEGEMRDLRYSRISLKNNDNV